MGSWKLELRPQLPHFLFWIIWIIPLILIPIGISIFYSEGQNTGQLITILTIAVLFPIVLLGLLKSAQKNVQTDCIVKIENRILSVTHKGEEKKVDLNEVDSVSLESKLGFATEIRAKKYKGENVSLSIAGTLSKEDQESLKQIFKEADVKMS